MKLSDASSLASRPEREIQRTLDALSDDECRALLYDWSFWRRPSQAEPEEDWTFWVINAGRGYGKTRCGAETVRSRVEGRTPLSAPPVGMPRAGRIAIVAETAADARDVLIEGPSGILRCSPPGYRPLYEPSKRRLTWPNGAIATTYNAREPDQLRGPEHDFVWLDELCKWRYAEATWDNMEFGLRLGDRPQGIITTTPRPIALFRKLIKDPGVIVTGGSTFENIGNLAPSFLKRIADRYEGTRLGKQELHAELLEEAEGALWHRDQIEWTRLRFPAETHARDLDRLLGRLSRIVVGVDPAGSVGKKSNETGIVVVGRDDEGHGYVLDDRTDRYTPEQWADAAISAFHDWGADRIVAERNNGGDMVESTIRMVWEDAPVRTVWASRGKKTRAEPVSALYEKNRVHHVGAFAELEDQQCTWEPNPPTAASPRTPPTGSTPSSGP